MVLVGALAKYEKVCGGHTHKSLLHAAVSVKQARRDSQHVDTRPGSALSRRPRPYAAEPTSRVYLASTPRGVARREG